MHLQVYQSYIQLLTFLLQSFSHWKHWAGCSTQENDDVTQKTELLVKVLI